MTLIEVMIVVTIMGLLSGAIAIAVTHQLQEARIKTTVMDEKTIRPIAATWRSDHPDEECPTPARLRDDKLLDVASKLTDAWGSPFVIVCEADETSVISPGPDRRANTEDDLREPDPEHGKVASR
jgi:prepilin-type N-terminal cleavage/methylation domain-containing protein